MAASSFYNHAKQPSELDHTLQATKDTLDKIVFSTIVADERCWAAYGCWRGAKRQPCAATRPAETVVCAVVNDLDAILLKSIVDYNDCG